MPIRRASKVVAGVVGVPVACVMYREHNKVGFQTERSLDEVLSTPTVNWKTRLYRSWQPIVFSLDPETAHSLAITAGVVVGKLSSASNRAERMLRCVTSAVAYAVVGPSILSAPNSPTQEPTRLSQTVAGIFFASPIGIAAGFDKKGLLIDCFSSIGTERLGHAEIGSVSSLAWEGNPRPRLFRLPADKAVINRMGLNNDGAAVVAQRLLDSRAFRVSAFRPDFTKVGVNITKTPDSAIEGDAAVADFVRAYTEIRRVPNVSWITLNISCPNTAEGKTFEDVAALESLVSSIAQAEAEFGRRSDGRPKLFLKLAPIASSGDWKDKFESMVGAIQGLPVDALVIANTVADRDMRLKSDKAMWDQRGGLSGPPIFERSLPLIQEAFKKGFTVIGVGGVSTGADAYRMIRSGASLIQLYTAMVYDGPFVFEDVRNGLERALVMDGFRSIHEAVGRDVIRDSAV